MEHELASHSTVWDKIWRDEDDQIVIFQWPNIWLVSWAIATMFSLFTNGKESDIFSLIGSALLITWSAMEITRGVNYFRRGLGTVVLVYAVVSVIKTIF